MQFVISSDDVDATPVGSSLNFLPQKCSLFTAVYVY